MSLKEYTAGLPQEKKLSFAIMLLRLTIPLWDDFAGKNDLSYVDSVVGMSHTVDKNIIRLTMDAVETHLRLYNSGTTPHLPSVLLELQHEFLDPVVSLQDGDWELPDPVLKTFYAAYNLLEATVGKFSSVFGEETLYVSINQSCDALLASNTLTQEALNKLLV